MKLSLPPFDREDKPEHKSEASTTNTRIRKAKTELDFDIGII